jgi:formamidopyrimidine-DNA glycosylase
MPELPEVETVRRALAHSLARRRIVAVEGTGLALRRPMDVPALQARLPRRTLLAPRRRGKFLLLDTDPSGSLLVHLGMTGRLLVANAGSERPRHTHLVVSLDDGRELRFVDPRRFGLAVWLDPGQEVLDPSLAGLGLEPLDPAAPRLLPPLLHARRAPLKTLLMDQRLIAGVGNIYATEALWRAGVRPGRAGCRTSLARLRRVVLAVQEVLEEAIAQGGTTIRDFAGPGGDPGAFAVRLQVYGHAGARCPRCGGTLRTTRLAGRSTVWCLHCQR